MKNNVSVERRWKNSTVSEWGSWTYYIKYKLKKIEKRTKNYIIIFSKNKYDTCW